MSFGKNDITGAVSGFSSILVWDAQGRLKVIGGGTPPPPAPVVWGSITGLVTNQTDLINYLGLNFYPLNSNPAGYVPDTRTLTINGTSYDLSADRSWTIPAGGTVTSVELAAGTGISLSGTNPITTSGTITVTNDAPDQVVVLTAGTGIDITGAYPSFTIDNTAPGVTYTVDNGLESQTTPTPDPNNFQLGGPLVRDTIIGGAARTYGIDFNELSYITGTTDQLNVVADDGTDNTELDISGGAGQIIHTNTTAGSQSAVLLQSSTAALQQISATSGGSIQFTSSFGLFGYYHTPVATTVQYQVEINSVGIHIVTPDVQALTAVVGQVLTLQNAVTGEVEFQTPTTGGIPVALPFTTDHITANGNPYVVGDVVYYLGDIYRCIAGNDSILPTDALYWTSLGAGFPLVQQPSDWNSTSGNNQILNKPTIPSPQGLQDVITTDPVLTQDNDIDGGGFTQSFINNYKFGIYAEQLIELSVNDGTQSVQFNLYPQAGSTSWVYDDGVGNRTAIEMSGVKMYIQTPGYASASNGDVLTLINNANGEVEFQTPGTTTGDSLSPLLLMGG